MSLRKKIILLFGLLSIVPLLALATLSYWQAGSLLRDSTQGRLEEEADVLATRLRDLGSGIQKSLREATRSEEGSSPGPHVSSQVEFSPPASALAYAEYIGRRRADGSLQLLSGSVPDHLVQCTGGTNSHLLRVSAVGGVEPGREVMEAGFWAGDLMEIVTANPNPAVALVDRANGSILFGGTCAEVGAEPMGSSGGQPEDIPNDPDRIERSRSSDTREAKVVAVAQVEGMGWDVMMRSSFGEVLGPLRSLTFLYWFIVLGLGASTALAFSILISRYTEPLSRLAQAAEEIGLGELDPWLPLNTSGEVDQLTVAFSRMVERIRRMMAQVNQSGRLAVVGQLSSYLAHEIRNPLSSIKMNQQRILRWINAGRVPEYCRGPIEISLREVDRLNASVTGVLQLSRASDVPREIVQLGPLLEEAVGLLGPRFRRQGVQLTLDLDPVADLILARPGQVKSVALNLMVNALDAQPGGGRLTIRTVLCRSPEDGRPAVSLHFQDGGPGVPGEIRDRIFEPFFTTKAAGAGIGLAMVKQAVEENDGEIHLSFRPSKDAGAEFVMFFPLAPIQVHPQGHSEAPHSASEDRPLMGVGASHHGGRVPTALFTPRGLEWALSSSNAAPEEDR